MLGLITGMDFKKRGSTINRMLHHNMVQQGCTVVMPIIHAFSSVFVIPTSMALVLVAVVGTSHEVGRQPSI